MKLYAEIIYGVPNYSVTFDPTIAGSPFIFTTSGVKEFDVLDNTKYLISCIDSLGCFGFFCFDNGCVPCVTTTTTFPPTTTTTTLPATTTTTTLPATTTTTTTVDVVQLNWNSTIEGDVEFRIYEDGILQEIIISTGSGGFLISNGDNIRVEFLIKNCIPFVNNISIDQSQSGGSTGTAGICPAVLDDYCYLHSDGTTMTIELLSTISVITTTTTTIDPYTYYIIDVYDCNCTLLGNGIQARSLTYLDMGKFYSYNGSVVQIMAVGGNGSEATLTGGVSYNTCIEVPCGPTTTTTTTTGFVCNVNVTIDSIIW